MSAFKNQFFELSDNEKIQGDNVYQLYEASIDNLERFKSLHAKLSNSLRFLPMLGLKINDKFKQEKSVYSKNILSLEESILIAAFSLRLYSDDSLLAKVNEKIQTLKTLMSQQESNTNKTLLNSFIRHGEMFLLFRKKEDYIVNLILDNQFEQALSILEEQMIKRYVMEDELAQKTRYYLIGYSVFLFCIILLFILNRRRLLKRVNTHQMLSEKDDLTGLSNRRHFINKFEEALQATIENDSYGAIIFIDLDGFKAVNDELGHNSGDYVLKKISRRLKKESDLNSHSGVNQSVARLGGDEFVILLTCLNKESLIQVLKKVTEKTLSQCSKSLGEKYKRFSITGSLGVVTFPDQGLNVVDLLHFADLAMYKSKKQGKNCCSFHIENT
jgi:diguanylate cyclase (GGDEF)-like protein